MKKCYTLSLNVFIILILLSGFNYSQDNTSNVKVDSFKLSIFEQLLISTQCLGCNNFTTEWKIPGDELYNIEIVEEVYSHGKLISHRKVLNTKLNYYEDQLDKKRILNIAISAYSNYNYINLFDIETNYNSGSVSKFDFENYQSKKNQLGFQTNDKVHFDGKVGEEIGLLIMADTKFDEILHPPQYYMDRLKLNHFENAVIYVAKIIKWDDVPLEIDVNPLHIEAITIKEAAKLIVKENPENYLFNWITSLDMKDSAEYELSLDGKRRFWQSSVWDVENKVAYFINIKDGEITSKKIASSGTPPMDVFTYNEISHDSPTILQDVKQNYTIYPGRLAFLKNLTTLSAVGYHFHLQIEDNELVMRVFGFVKDNPDYKYEDFLVVIVNDYDLKMSTLTGEDIIKLKNLQNSS